MNAIERSIALAYAQSSKVIYMAGQSNMQGRDVDGTNLTSRANDGSIYEYRNSDGVERNTFLTNYPSGGSISSYGPNVGSMRTLRAAGETDNYVIRYGAGGHCLPAFIPESDRLINPQSDLPVGNTDRSALMVNFFNNSTDDMIARHFRKPSEVIFVWYQGAEDSKYNGEQAYGQDLSGLYDGHLWLLITRMRGSALNYSAGHVVIIRSPDWNSNTPGSKPYQDVVRAAQVSVANSTSNCDWLTSDINQSVTTTWEDASHINAASQERLGIDLAALI
jgi:hypothetical protein